MSPEQVRELWGRFLAGGDISVEDQRALTDALDADPELRESLLENLHLDGMLQAMATTRRQGEGFVRNLTECLDVERDGTRFVKKVELRLNEPPPPPQAGAGTGRRSKPPTARAFRRRSGGTADETAWKPALIAAGVFAAIFLVVLASTSPKPRLDSARRQPLDPPKVEAPVPPPSPMPPVPKAPVGDPAPTPLIPRKFPDKSEATPTPPRPDGLRGTEEPKPVAPKETPAPGGTRTEGSVITMRLDRSEGNAYIVQGLSKVRPKKANQPVPLGSDVETIGVSSSAVLAFEDKTWVELGGNSSFREVKVPPGGREVLLGSGTLLSHIEKQPLDRPMLFVTPNAEVTILGTTVRLTFDPKTMATTLEVKEGKVLLTRLADRKSVEVVTGQFAVVVDGGDLRPQKSFPDEVLVKFGPTDVSLKPGWVLDSGDEYDGARGYGWVGPKDGGPVPGLFWRNPGTGELEQKRYGRFTARRIAPAGTDPAKAADPLRTTDVVAGWAGQSETWRMPIPNGRYLVSVCCGDISYEQGPHHVSIEGKQVIDQKKNKPGEFVEAKDIAIEVKDGELTMIVGGNPGQRKSSDGSTDTCINYLSIKRIRK